MFDTSAAAFDAGADLDGRGDRIRGYVDSVTDDTVSGWVMLPGEPAYRCTVALKEGDRVLAQAEASRFRGDVAESGIGDGLCGFRFDLPGRLRDGGRHELRVEEQRTGLLVERALDAPDPRPRPADGPLDPGPPPAGRAVPGPAAPAGAGSVVLFDVSDLIYYLGHHAHLTGIQRVQSSIVLAILERGLLPPDAVRFVSYDARGRRWVVIPAAFLANLLRDLFAPESRRAVAFRAVDARVGLLPGAYALAGGVDLGADSVLCLLGAAWVQQDYFHHVLRLRRDHGTRFVMMVHDLIPVYAPHTCDPGTVACFEAFMRRALRHADHFLSVSESTAADLRRYARSSGFAAPAVTVTRNGSSFSEFAPAPGRAGDLDLPARFVLFVSTVEGRKNHGFVLDLWKRLVRTVADAPALICVGRVGWRADAFLADFVDTDGLGGRVKLLQEVSDEQLSALYERCLFTVYPSLYEGWGLPVGESLAAGKVCIMSDRSSLPEVAGDLGVYIDIDDADGSFDTLTAFVVDDALRRKQEARIRREFRPTGWSTVAAAVVSCLDGLRAQARTDHHPCPAAEYGREISFASFEKRADGGRADEDLLARLSRAQRGHFLFDNLREESFLVGEAARDGGTWAEPESWGTWLCAGGGSIVLALPPTDAEACYVYLRVRAVPDAADLAVAVGTGGATAWSGEIGARSRDIAFRVRRTAATRDPWRLKVDLQFALPPERLAALRAVDVRTPVLGLERMVVVPSTDLPTRTDILTRTLGDGPR